MKEQHWRDKYKFHPSLISWIDSCKTQEQLQNFAIMLPEFCENDMQKSNMRLYMMCKSTKIYANEIEIWLHRSHEVIKSK